MKQDRSSTGEKKKFKQVSKWEKRARLPLDDYKARGIISAILGIATNVFILLATSAFIAVGSALLIAGVLGLFAFIAGVSSVGKLKGIWKIPSIVGIITAVPGIIAGALLVLLLIFFRRK